MTGCTWLLFLPHLVLASLPVFSQSGPEILTATSSQTHFHNPADQILDVYHNTPGMTVVPWYDPNGNLTQVIHTVTIEGVEPPLTFTSTYEYDVDNRLVAVESPLLVAEYKYDGLGHLLEINEAGTIRRLVRDRVDGLTRPLMETDVWGNPTRSWLWANGSLVAQVEAGGAVRYAHFNELGHLLALTDESGTVTDQFAYHPYGRLVARTGTNDVPFLYMGAHGVMAAGHDLYLTRHRAYNANLMRWHSVDPLGIEGGANLYAYTGGNPIYFIDALGLARTSPSWGQGTSSSSSSYNVPVLRSPSELRNNEVAATWGASLGFGGTMTPDMMRSTALDWAMAPGGAILGGMADDAARAAISYLRAGGSAFVQTGARTPSTLYHYTSNEAAESIVRQGLHPGRGGFSYATPQGGLSPIQAQIELALPANRPLPGAVLRIDVEGLARGGITPALGPRPVQGNLPGFGAGGGTEVLFDQHIPAQFIHRVP